MSLPAHAKAMSKEVEALHNLHGRLNDKEVFLDHIEAFKVWTYFTSTIVSSHCDGEVKLRRFSSRPTSSSLNRCRKKSSLCL
jgi:hypothetical protein